MSFNLNSFQDGSDRTISSIKRKIIAALTEHRPIGVFQFFSVCLRALTTEESMYLIDLAKKVGVVQVNGMLTDWAMSTGLYKIKRYACSGPHAAPHTEIVLDFEGMG